MRQLFLDLDGVLADFNGHYFDQFGITVDRESDVANPDGMFDRIEAHGTFFRDIPPFHDAQMMWMQACILHPNPIILTGVAHSVTNCEKDKREWVAEYITPKAQVICCESAKKAEFGRPGDVLIDDWHKYRPVWEKMGGIFILHRDRADSIKQAWGLFRL